MEMQNIMQQMTDMLAMNSRKDYPCDALTTNSASKRDFNKLMNEQMKGGTCANDGSNVASGEKTVYDNAVNTVGVQKVNEARQQQLQESTEETSNLIVGENLDELEPEVQEIVVACFVQISVQVSETLNITPKKLEEIMSQLGIGYMDLQDVNNVQNLVLQTSGEINVTALLTNENLGEQVKNILEIVNKLTENMANELGMDRKDFANILSEMEEGILSAMNSYLEANVTDAELVLDENYKTDKTSFVQEETTEKKVQEPAYKDELVYEDEPVLQEGFASEVGKENTQVVEKTIVQLSDSVRELSTKNEKDQVETIQNSSGENVETIVEKKVEVEVSTGGKDFSQKEEEPAPMFEQIVNHIAEAKVVQVENVQESVEVTQQMYEIVEQVVEQIKVTITADTSEMSMQLNPEHLGKVNLSVIAKEGHITAQFTTENEMAKQALENQIQQLRDTLSEQGLKVEKVEVSVSDFSFQQGNDANAEEQKENQRNAHAKQVQRRLNIADINDVSELTEEEELAVKIMRSNGGQIDYTA